VPGSLGVVVSLVYWALRRLLELLVLRMRSERAKEIEILVLRHQLRVWSVRSRVRSFGRLIELCSPHLAVCCRAPLGRRSW
jgi:hypothetical protein